jgi:ACS family hexuronate transporter-like MFS transporter
MTESKLKAGSAQATVPAETMAGFKLRHLRWWIIGLVFLATLINYVDRLTVSVLAPVITKDLGLSGLEYASISTWFLLAYTISQGLSGKLYDRVGTRRGFTISILVWSVAAMAHALARGLASFSVFRFVLGLGEAGNWPGAAKTTAEWFPARERAFAMAIFNSGAAIGAIAAPPLIIWLQLKYGWPTTFLITGTLGFLWLALWLLVYQPPDRHRWLTAEERALLEDGETERGRDRGKERVELDRSFPPSLRPSVSPSPRWRDLLRYKQVWALVLARLLVDPVWWLYITWLPLFLNKVHGFDLKKIGLFAWVPYVAADAGSLLGGFTSGFLIKRGWSVDRARKAAIVIGAALMPAGILAARAGDLMKALAFIAVVLFGFQFWINNVQTLPSDFFADKVVASVAGLGGVGAGIGSMIFTLTTGWVVDHFGYTPILTAAGVLAPLGTVVLLTLTGTIKKLPA